MYIRRSAFFKPTLGSANKNIGTLKRDLIHDTKNILEWFTNNGLQANPQKFQTMFLSTHPAQSTIDIPINGINIPTQDKVTLPRSDYRLQIKVQHTHF